MCHSSRCGTLRAEGGVVTVSGLENGSSPNRAKTLLRATTPHDGGFVGVVTSCES